LFRGLLEVKPHRRITCDGLWANTWICNQDDSDPNEHLAPITLASTSTAETQHTINMSVVDEVSRAMGVSQTAVIQAVVQHRCVRMQSL